MENTVRIRLGEQATQNLFEIMKLLNKDSATHTANIIINQYLNQLRAQEGLKMNTQLFAKSEKELSPYFAVYREILTATGWKGWEQVKVKTPEDKLVPTGEIVEVVYPFSCEDKILWCWMLDRFQFFKEGKNVWFDNQDEIAAYTGISVSTVKRFIKKLSVSGVLVIKPKPMGGARVSNSYVITQDLALVQADKATQKPSVSLVAQRSGESNISAQPDVYVESEAAGEEWVKESIPCEDYEGIQFSIEAESSSYEDWESCEVETVAAPEKVEVSDIKIDLSSMPLSRWNRNGREISDQLFDWFEDNGFYIEDCRTGQVLHNSSKRRYVMSGKDLIPLSANLASLDEQDESFLPF
ncbi:hypothetical protein RCF34_20675 [Pseudomonas sp. 102515]|uniref:hypothetical protein n=1 Tax=Pseudomonas sp. 102515 TaxID=3071568 RepID=UPI002801175C|nr:hypothetical protein [Pseudomonas sp. 102515]MDQ7915529.1 hypothetical protein [Pseudomonas sp. 102515]